MHKNDKGHIVSMNPLHGHYLKCQHTSQSLSSWIVDFDAAFKDYHQVLISKYILFVSNIKVASLYCI